MEFQNIKFLVSFLFVLFGCSIIRYYDIKQFRELPPTHEINSKLLLQAFDVVSKKGALEYFDPARDVICVYIIEDRKQNEISISICVDSFNYLQMTYSSSLLRLSGYTYYDKYPVLIFGDTDKFFKINENVRVKQVLRYKNKDEIPYINDREGYKFKIIYNTLVEVDLF